MAMKLVICMTTLMIKFPFQMDKYTSNETLLQTNILKKCKKLLFTSRK